MTTFKPRPVGLQNFDSSHVMSNSCVYPGLNRSGLYPQEKEETIENILLRILASLNIIAYFSVGSNLFYFSIISTLIKNCILLYGDAINFTYKIILERQRQLEQKNLSWQLLIGLLCVQGLISVFCISCALR